MQHIKPRCENSHKHNRNKANNHINDITTRTFETGYMIHTQSPFTPIRVVFLKPQVQKYRCSFVSGNQMSAKRIILTNNQVSKQILQIWWHFVRKTKEKHVPKRPLY